MAYSVARANGSAVEGGASGESKGDPWECGALGPGRALRPRKRVLSRGQREKDYSQQKVDKKGEERVIGREDGPDGAGLATRIRGGPNRGHRQAAPPREGVLGVNIRGESRALHRESWSITGSWSYWTSID
jgi:hypothetical protein